MTLLDDVLKTILFFIRFFYVLQSTLCLLLFLVTYFDPCVNYFCSCCIPERREIYITNFFIVYYMKSHRPPRLPNFPQDLVILRPWIMEAKDVIAITCGELTNLSKAE